MGAATRVDWQRLFPFHQKQCTGCLHISPGCRLEKPLSLGRTADAGRGRYSLLPEAEVQECFARMPSYLACALMPFQREVRRSCKGSPPGSPFAMTPSPSAPHLLYVLR